MNRSILRRWIDAAEDTLTAARQSGPAVLDVAIVPASPEASPSAIVDVTLVPAMFSAPMPRYRVEGHGLVWVVIDTTDARRKFPLFHSESCAIACVAALNLTGVK